MEGKLCYVLVRYENKKSSKEYYYISNIPEIKKNDKVLVNCAGEKVTGKVMNVEYYDKNNVPYPVYKTKKILKIISEEENKVNDKTIEREDVSEINESKIKKEIIAEKNINGYTEIVEKKDDLNIYNDIDNDMNYHINFNKNSKIKKCISVICCFFIIAISMGYYINNSENHNVNETLSNNVIGSNHSNSSNNTTGSNYSNSSSNTTGSNYSSSSNSSTGSSYVSSSSSKYNKDPDATYGSGYKRTVGVNGAITYYCTRHCSAEKCTKNCKHCLNNQKSFPNSTCTFHYQFSKGQRDKGWIGCPQCGDITYDQWHDFYKF